MAADRTFSSGEPQTTQLRRPPSIAEWGAGQPFPTSQAIPAGYGTWTPDAPLRRGRSVLYYVVLFTLAAVLGAGLGLAAAFHDAIQYRVDHQWSRIHHG
ncbi:hypothetical protein ACIB24_21050 [Spongisporangium articulatum]|uniref:Uncharacterized protein n=1 Tax=Spongisporangium articulatum TaxID=3362603 RepID=A0ABW8AV98_9ACTN